MSHEVYKNFWGYCTICKKINAKRDMNKLYWAPSHISTVNPRIKCFICDDCLPILNDFLEDATVKYVCSQCGKEKLSRDERIKKAFGKVGSD